MNPEYFRFLYDYNYWARDRLLAATEGMSEGEYASPNNFTYGSIRGICTHLLSAEAICLRRWKNDSSSPEITEASLPNLAALTALWREEEDKMRAFLAGLTEGTLQNDLVERRPSGQEKSYPLWQLMAHVVNHGTQHRSEAAEALTMIGRSPGNLDLTVLLREGS